MVLDINVLRISEEMFAARPLPWLLLSLVMPLFFILFYYYALLSLLTILHLSTCYPNLIFSSEFFTDSAAMWFTDPW
jgi:hypothetical protein